MEHGFWSSLMMIDSILLKSKYFSSPDRSQRMWRMPWLVWLRRGLTKNSSALSNFAKQFGPSHHLWLPINICLQYVGQICSTGGKCVAGYQSCKTTADCTAVGENNTFVLLINTMLRLVFVGMHTMFFFVRCRLIFRATSLPRVSAPSLKVLIAWQTGPERINIALVWTLPSSAPCPTRTLGAFGTTRQMCLRLLVEQFWTIIVLKHLSSDFCGTKSNSFWWVFINRW